MSTFHLRVVTAESDFYDGEVDRIVVRTSEGDVGILPKHVPYVAALGIGGLSVYADGQCRVAAVSGGFVDVAPEGTTILARTCEWADEIDINRAKEAARRAQEELQKQSSAHENDVATVKLKKAVNRIRIAEK